MDTFSCLGRRELALLHLYDIHPDRSYPVVATSSALWCLVSCQLPGRLLSFKVLIYYSLLNPQVFREPGPVGWLGLAKMTCRACICMMPPIMPRRSHCQEPGIGYARHCDKDFAHFIPWTVLVSFPILRYKFRNVIPQGDPERK